MSRRFTKTLPGLLLWSRRATGLARQHRVRFVHCGNVKPAGYPARWVYERTHVPYGVFLYGADLLSEQHKYHSSKFKRRSARAILGGAAVYIAISNWTRDLALTVLGELGLDGHGQRLRVVHLGTDPEHFRPGVETTAMRVRLGIADGGGEGRWLVTVARLEKHKGIDTVLAALPAIAERAPDVRYAVAGGGPERESLEKLAHKLGVADRVRFLGQVSERDLPALYNLATVYVGASRRAERIGVEGFGIALVEASACGVPVVGGNAGGVPDAVRDGETGFLVPPEEPAAVVEAGGRLPDDPPLARGGVRPGGRPGRAHAQRPRPVDGARLPPGAASRARVRLVRGTEACRLPRPLAQRPPAAALRDRGARHGAAPLGREDGPLGVQALDGAAAVRGMRRRGGEQPLDRRARALAPCRAGLRRSRRRRAGRAARYDALTLPAGDRSAVHPGEAWPGGWTLAPHGLAARLAQGDRHGDQGAAHRTGGGPYGALRRGGCGGAPTAPRAPRRRARVGRGRALPRLRVGRGPPRAIQRRGSLRRRVAAVRPLGGRVRHLARRGGGVRARGGGRPLGRRAGRGAGRGDGHSRRSGRAGRSGGRDRVAAPGRGGAPPPRGRRAGRRGEVLQLGPGGPRLHPDRRRVSASEVGRALIA